MPLKASTIGEAFEEIRARTQDPRTGKYPISQVNAAKRVGVNRSNWSRVESTDVNQHPGDELLEAIAKEWSDLTSLKELHRLREQSPPPTRKVRPRTAGRPRTDTPSPSDEAKSRPRRAEVSEVSTTARVSSGSKAAVGRRSGGRKASAPSAAAAPSPAASHGSDRMQERGVPSPGAPVMGTQGERESAATTATRAPTRGAVPAASDFRRSPSGIVLPRGIKRDDVAPVRAAASPVEAPVPPVSLPSSQAPGEGLPRDAAEAPAEAAASVAVAESVAAASRPSPAPAPAAGASKAQVRTPRSLLEVHQGLISLLAKSLEELQYGAGRFVAPLSQRFAMAAAIGLDELDRLGGQDIPSAEAQAAASAMAHDLWRVAARVADPEGIVPMPPTHTPQEQEQMEVFLTHAPGRSDAYRRLRDVLPRLICPTEVSTEVQEQVERLLLHSLSLGARARGRA